MPLFAVMAMAVAPWIGMHDGVRPLDVLTRGAMAVHAQSHTPSRVLGQERAGHGATATSGHAPDQVHAPGSCSCCPIDSLRAMAVALWIVGPFDLPTMMVLARTERDVPPETPPPQA